MIRKKSWIVGTIAQLLLIIIIVPVVMKILSFFVNFDSISEQTNSFVVNLIGSIPCFSTWLTIIVKFFDQFPINNSDIFEKLLTDSNIVSIAKTFFQAILTAVIAKIFKAIHNIISSNGAPIISTFLAVLSATVINYFLSKSSTLKGLILFYGGVIAIMILGIIFMFRSAFSTLKMRQSVFLLDLIVNGLSAVITSCYLTVMIFAVNGCFGSMSETIYFCFIITVVELINLILCALLSLAYDKDKERGIIS